MPLSIGSLKLGFLGVPKMDAQKVALRNSNRTFGDPFFGSLFGHFFGSNCVQILIFLIAARHRT